MTFIPGHVGAITLGANPVVTAKASDLSIDAAVATKAIIGQGWTEAAEGQLSGSFNISGYATPASIGALMALRLAPGAKAFSLQVGEANQATDGGVFTGSVILSNFTVSQAADGDTEWSCTATTTGAVDYNPPAGPVDESSSSSAGSSSSSSSS